MQMQQNDADAREQHCRVPPCRWTGPCFALLCLAIYAYISYKVQGRLPKTVLLFRRTLCVCVVGQAGRTRPRLKHRLEMNYSREKAHRTRPVIRWPSAADRALSSRRDRRPKSRRKQTRRKKQIMTSEEIQRGAAGVPSLETRQKATEHTRSKAEAGAILVLGEQREERWRGPLVTSEAKKRKRNEGW